VSKVLLLAVAAALAIAGVALAGPLGHERVWHGSLVKVRARVMAQGSPPSPIDGAPSAMETIAIWASAFTAEDHQHRSLQLVAGGDRPREETRFQVATGGRAVTVIVDPKDTKLALANGPSRRIAYPGQMPIGRGIVGLPVASYVAISHRIVEGTNLVITGVRDGDEIRAQGIADEDHEAALGDDYALSSKRRAAGFALAALGLALLIGKIR
jgi:hypothetical protein